jgi:hypothetical protein
LFPILDDPLSHPILEKLLFFSPSRQQSRQRGRQFARICPNQFVHPNHDGLGTLGVVMQREKWLIVQVCLVYLDEPDGPTHDTR